MDTKDWAKHLPEDAREVLEAGLGAGTPLGAKKAVWSALATKLSATTTAAAAASSATSVLSLLKPFGVGLALGVVTATGISVVPRLRQAEEVTAPHAVVPPAPAAAARSADPARPAVRAAALPSVKDSVSVRRSEQHAMPAASSAPPLPGASIAEFPTETPARAAENEVLAESRRVAWARSALQQGAATRVLAELDALEREFPNGMLVQERGALRIEALLSLGERQRARDEARRFLARYPRSLHAQAVERALH